MASSTISQFPTGGSSGSLMYIPKIDAMRKIVKAPNVILHQVSLPVVNIDGLVREVAKEMMQTLTTLRERELYLGMAAVQLGEPLRIIVVLFNMYSREFREPVIILNPEIVKKSEKLVESREGCLSLSGTYTVKRHKLVKVQGLDLNGARVVYKERQRPAFALQHEIDHLDGKLISDK